MPSMQGVAEGAAPTAVQAAIQKDGSQLTLPNTSVWLVGDPANDTPPIGIGDLILFKNNFGMSIQTVTSVDATHIYFAQNSANDWFHFNQRSTSLAGTALLHQVGCRVQHRAGREQCDGSVHARQRAGAVPPR